MSDEPTEQTLNEDRNAVYAVQHQRLRKFLLDDEFYVEWNQQFAEFLINSQQAGDYDGWNPEWKGMSDDG